MQYLISYIAVGAFFGIIGAINNRSLGFLGIPRLLLIIIFWPLIVIITPDDLLKKNVIDELKSQDNLDDISRSFQSISEGDLVALNEEERLRVERTKFFGNSGTTFFSDSTNFDDVLNRFWIDEIPPEAYKSLNLARWRLNDDFVVDSDIRYSLRQPDWFVGFSTEFVKSIAKVDKNKRNPSINPTLPRPKISKRPTAPPSICCINTLSAQW
jgi:hypothetical protein